SINELFSQARSRGWNINPTDQEALSTFEQFARNAYSSPPANIDYIIDELEGGSDLRAAVIAAMRLLHRDGTGVQCGDLFAHFTGCCILVIEKKTNSQARIRPARKAVKQVKSIYHTYRDLHERNLAHTWMAQNATVTAPIRGPFLEAEFNRFGGIAFIHIDRLHGNTRRSLLSDFVVEGRPDRRGSIVKLERYPYIIIVENSRGF
ncbi:MAG: hypothetical protein ACXABY_26265, partial [Candidatus Thorarchaeota archaeon]